MIAVLNLAVDDVESQLATDPSGPVDVADVAARTGTTEHHLRRMFASLAGMPLSEYVRRRRMSLAAADLVGTGHDLLTIAVRYGYGSTEAFGRAFRAVHGAGPSDVRRDGGPLRTQPRIRFHLTVEGSVPMDTRITDLPAVRLVGYAKRVPLIHEGVNPHIAEHVASIPVEEIVRLKGLNDTEPPGCSPSATTSTRTGPRAASSPTSREWPPPPHHPRGSTSSRSRWDLGRLPHRGPAPDRSAGRLGSDCHDVVPVPALAAASRTRDRRDAGLRCRRRNGDL